MDCLHTVTRITNPGWNPSNRLWAYCEVCETALIEAIDGVFIDMHDFHAYEQEAKWRLQYERHLQITKEKDNER